MNQPVVPITSVHEPGRIPALTDICTNAAAVNASSKVPQPLDRIVTSRDGVVLRYWSDGSLRVELSPVRSRRRVRQQELRTIDMTVTQGVDIGPVDLE
jgi:hypothetical protein